MSCLWTSEQILKPLKSSNFFFSPLLLSNESRPSQFWKRQLFMGFTLFMTNNEKNAAHPSSLPALKSFIWNSSPIYLSFPALSHTNSPYLAMLDCLFAVSQTCQGAFLCPLPLLNNFLPLDPLRSSLSVKMPLILHDHRKINFFIKLFPNTSFVVSAWAWTSVKVWTSSNMDYLGCHTAEYLNSWHLKSEWLGFNPDSVSFLLCDLVYISSPICASVPSLTK